MPAAADVVVVGAGLAGLAAAGRLQEAGLDVVVVERSDAVGGRVRTDVVDGFRLDRGFQLLNPAYPEAKRVLDLDALDLQPFLAGLMACTQDKRHSLGDPLRLPTSIPSSLTAPIGSMKEKLAFGTWVAGLGLGSDDPIRDGEDRPLIEELRARGIGGALTDTVLRPFLSGVLAETELTSSQRMVSMLLRAFARGNPSVPALGMQAMPEQLEARLAPGPSTSGCSSARSSPDTWTPTPDGSVPALPCARPTGTRPPPSRFPARRCAPSPPGGTPRRSHPPTGPCSTSTPSPRCVAARWPTPS